LGQPVNTGRRAGHRRPAGNLVTTYIRVRARYGRGRV